ncbi:hypothetical protein RFI_38666, partial [Reticulomyxa filosa]
VFVYGILKQLNNLFYSKDIMYGSSELRDMILSGSQDTTVRLWDIRSGQQIRLFNGHLHSIMSVGYSPFVVDNSEIGGISNVICSGSLDNTIRFWDIRSNKKELYVIKESRGIICLKFLESKKKTKSNMSRKLILSFFLQFKSLFNSILFHQCKAITTVKVMLIYAIVQSKTNLCLGISENQ